MAMPSTISGSFTLMVASVCLPVARSVTTTSEANSLGMPVS